jgi:hypothetical protein
VSSTFLNWQHSTKFVPVVLAFRVGKRLVRVPEAELARLPLEQRRKIVRLIDSASLML